MMQTSAQIEGHEKYLLPIRIRRLTILSFVCPLIILNTVVIVYLYQMFAMWLNDTITTQYYQNMQQFSDDLAFIKQIDIQVAQQEVLINNYMSNIILNDPVVVTGQDDSDGSSILNQDYVDLLADDIIDAYSDIIFNQYLYTLDYHPTCTFDDYDQYLDNQYIDFTRRGWFYYNQTTQYEDFSNEMQQDLRHCVFTKFLDREIMFVQEIIDMAKPSTYSGYSTDIFCQYPLQPRAWSCEEQIYGGSPDPTLYRPTQRPWYIGQQEAGNVSFIQDIYVFAASSQLGMTQCSPLLKNIDQDDIQNFSFETNYEFVLLDGEGYLYKGAYCLDIIPFSILNSEFLQISSQFLDFSYMILSPVSNKTQLSNYTNEEIQQLKQYSNSLIEETYSLQITQIGIESPRKDIIREQCHNNSVCYTSKEEEIEYGVIYVQPYNESYQNNGDNQTELIFMFSFIPHVNSLGEFNDFQVFIIYFSDDTIQQSIEFITQQVYLNQTIISYWVIYIVITILYVSFLIFVINRFMFNISLLPIHQLVEKLQLMRKKDKNLKQLEKNQNPSSDLRKQSTNRKNSNWQEDNQTSHNMEIKVGKDFKSSNREIDHLLINVQQLQKTKFLAHRSLMSGDDYESILNYNEVAKIFKEHKNNKQLAFIYLNMGWIHLMRDEFVNGFRFMNEAIVLIDKVYAGVTGDTQETKDQFNLRTLDMMVTSYSRGYASLKQFYSEYPNLKEMFVKNPSYTRSEVEELQSQFGAMDKLHTYLQKNARQVQHYFKKCINNIDDLKEYRINTQNNEQQVFENLFLDFKIFLQILIVEVQLHTIDYEWLNRDISEIMNNIERPGTPLFEEFKQRSNRQSSYIPKQSTLDPQLLGVEYKFNLEQLDYIEAKIKKLRGMNKKYKDYEAFMIQMRFGLDIFNTDYLNAYLMYLRGLYFKNVNYDYNQALSYFTESLMVEEYSNHQLRINVLHNIQDILTKTHKISYGLPKILNSFEVEHRAINFIFDTSFCSHTYLRSAYTFMLKIFDNMRGSDMFGLKTIGHQHNLQLEPVRMNRKLKREYVNNLLDNIFFFNPYIVQKKHLLQDTLVESIGQLGQIGETKVASTKFAGMKFSSPMKWCVVVLGSDEFPKDIQSMIGQKNNINIVIIALTQQKIPYTLAEKYDELCYRTPHGFFLNIHNQLDQKKIDHMFSQISSRLSYHSVNGYPMITYIFDN